MNDILLDITAFSPKRGKNVDLKFFSVEEAKKLNPNLRNFRVRGFLRK